MCSDVAQLGTGDARARFPQRGGSWSTGSTAGYPQCEWCSYLHLAVACAFGIAEFSNSSLVTPRALRCPHCGLSHDASMKTCPATGQAIQGVSPAARLRPPRRRIIPAVQPIPSRKAPKPQRDLVGRVIGDKYGVTNIIGQGGMGTVYEAEHLAIGRLVAVKVLQEQHAGKKEAISRLQHEARVVGTLGHPNICEIYDMGRLPDGSPYLVMERLHGESLATKIEREGPVAPTVLIDIMVQVLSALASAHDKGVIHRDLKPDNIFLSARAGVPPLAKLLDFGISKASGIDDTAVNLTRTGMVMGTPYYMAPEQARGDRALDQRVDLWAVGVILYEALSARRPFIARNYNALLVQILTTRHRPVQELHPGVPHSLASLIDSALSKDRENRPDSARSLQAQLEACRREIEAAIASQAPRPGRRGRRATVKLPAVGTAAKAPPGNRLERTSEDAGTRKRRDASKRTRSTYPPRRQPSARVDESATGLIPPDAPGRKRRGVPPPLDSVTFLEMEDSVSEDPTIVLHGAVGDLTESTDVDDAETFHQVLSDELDGDMTVVDPPSFTDASPPPVDRGRRRK